MDIWILYGCLGLLWSEYAAVIKLMRMFELLSWGSARSLTYNRTYLCESTEFTNVCTIRLMATERIVDFVIQSKPISLSETICFSYLVAPCCAHILHSHFVLPKRFRIYRLLLLRWSTMPNKIISVEMSSATDGVRMHKAWLMNCVNLKLVSRTRR